MRKSRLTNTKQQKLIEHFVAGTTARCTADLVNVNTKTATYYFYRLREIICLEIESDAAQYFAGEIEVDESYFGGVAKESEEGVLLVKYPCLAC